MTRLKAIDQSRLTPLVRSALENDAAQVIDWNYQAITGSLAQAGGPTYGVYRFTETAQILDERVP